MSYLLLMVAVLLSVYGQVVLKWQMSGHGGPTQTYLCAQSFVRLLSNPWIWSVGFVGVCVLLLWATVLRELELSFAYPLYVGSTFALVLILGVFFFREPLTLSKVLSTGLIIAGLIVGSQK